MKESNFCFKEVGAPHFDLNISNLFLLRGLRSEESAESSHEHLAQLGGHELVGGEAMRGSTFTLPGKRPVFGSVKL